ncbi:hypothetical protein FOZ63_019247, partial [Perkinsus olseni]
AASDLQREAARRDRDLPIAPSSYDGGGPVEQRPMNSKGSPPVVMMGPSPAPSTLPHAALFDTSWRLPSAAYSSFATVPGFFGDTPERQAFLGMTTATRQSIHPTLVQRRSSIPSSSAYKQVLSPKLTVLPPATQLVVGGREDPRGGVPGRTGDQNPGRHLNHHLVHHHKRPPGHTEHHVMAGKVPDTTINTRVNHYRSVWWFMLHTILLSLAPPLLSSFRAFPCGGGHQPSPFEMEGQNSVPWPNYHLIVPQGDGDAAEQDTDVRGQVYHSGRWSDPMPPHAS